MPEHLPLVGPKGWLRGMRVSGSRNKPATVAIASVKIATFNINNVNRRLSNLLAWLDDSRPDVVCLQELKAADREFPVAAIESAGYGAAWCGQRTWNGVAILARAAQPVITHKTLPGDSKDLQSRYLEAAIDGVLITSIYAPNGNPQPGPKFDYKLAWLDRLIEHARSLIDADVPVVLAGDYNVVPTPADIYPTRSWDGDALVQPASRERFRRLLEQGWIDSIRSLHPKEPMFTFWDYKRGRWGRDAGLRIDHLLVSPALSGRIAAAGVDKTIRGEEGASDHAPAWVVLKAARKKSVRGDPVSD